jgi:hypothetical protein
LITFADVLILAGSFTFLLMKQVETMTTGNSGKPGTETAVWTQGIQVVHERDESQLGNIGRVLMGQAIVERDGVNKAFVLLQDLIPSSRVTLTSATDEFFV